MKHLIVAVAMMWNYESFYGNIEVMLRFLSELSPHQQKMAKVTCVYDKYENLCFVFYPVSRTPPKGWK